MAEQAPIPNYEEMSLEELMSEIEARTAEALPTTGQETAMGDEGIAGEELQDVVPTTDVDIPMPVDDDMGVGEQRISASRSALRNRVNRFENPI